MLNLDDLLACEVRAGVFDACSADGEMFFWPFIRHGVLLAYLEKATGTVPAHASGPGRNPMVLARYFAQTLWWHPGRVKEAPLLFLSSGAVNMLHGRVYRNRIHDHFLSLLPRGSTNLLEDSFQWAYRRPREVPVLYHDLAQIQANLLGRICGLRHPDRTREIEAFIAGARAAFPHPAPQGLWETAGADLIRFARNLPHYRDIYRRILDRARPRFLCLDNACYGRRAYILRIAREMGIRTGELQHGLISAAHPAYNYPRELTREHPYGQYLPQVLLTFGAYWADCIRVPVDKVPVGFPYLREEACKVSGPPQTDVLVVSDGVNPEVYVDLVSALAARAPSLGICFKMHPGEVPFAEHRYSRLAALPQVRLAGHEPIYTLIGSARHVVGCFSTTLYEALAFGKRPFVLDNELSRQHIHGDVFIRFSDAAELAGLLEGRAVPGEVGVDLGAYWAPDGDARFLNLMALYLARP